MRWVVESQLDLAALVGKLERDIFWTRCATGILFLCLCAAGFAIWPRRPQAVEANEFLLRDQKGNVLARLGQSVFGDTCLTLTARDNVSVASLCVQNTEGSILDLHNLKSESRAVLTPGFNTFEPMTRIQPALIINDSMSSHFVHINLGADTAMVLGHGSNDSVRISSPVGEPRITLFGTDQKPVWSTH